MAAITDLHYELLSYIIILLVQSPDGAAELSRILSVCQRFMEFSIDEQILKAVVFDDVKVMNCYYLNHQIHPLLKKCAQAGNVAAEFLLAKIVLVSSSELFVMRRFEALSFVPPFLPNQASTSEASRKSLDSYQLVKLFLGKCSPFDLEEMETYLIGFVEYCTRSEYALLREAVDKMCATAARVRTVEGLSDTKARLDQSVRDVLEIGETVHEIRAGTRILTPRQKTIADAILRCSLAAASLRYHTFQAGLDYDEFFGVRSNPETLKKYYENVCKKFEQCRAIAVSLYESCFP